MDKIGFSIYMAYRKMQIHFGGIAEEMGIDSAPLSALTKLWREDGLTITELGEKLFLKASTITSLIDRMERDGLVRRKRNQEDRRVVKIYLTPKAKELQKEFPNFEESLIEKIQDKLSQEEISTLIELLGKFESAM